MMGKRFLALSGFVIAATVVACGGADDGAPEGDGANGGAGENGGVRIGPDGMPVGPDGQPLPAKLDGKYEMASAFDLTTAGIFPDVANDTLKALSNFREKPSQTLVDLLDAANVPIVGAVMDVIPGPVRGFFYDWFDDHVFKALYASVPVTRTVTSMLDDIASFATRFELVTALDLPVGNGIGDSRATHTISGIGYTWDTKRHVITAPELVSKLVLQPVEANAVELEKRSPELETGRLILGDHRFSVPIGSFAVYAADELARDKFGAPNLRGAIGKVVDCSALAKDLAGRCVDPVGPGKVCVGHESEIEKLCTSGLDLLVAQIQQQLRRLDLPLVRLEEGTAQMWDAKTPGGAVDATIDRLDKGFWRAEIGAGKDFKPVLATFGGVRIGDSAQPSTH